MVGKKRSRRLRRDPFASDDLPSVGAARPAARDAAMEVFAVVQWSFCARLRNAVAVEQAIGEGRAGVCVRRRAFDVVRRACQHGAS